jgi:hypothetical protein
MVEGEAKNLSKCDLLEALSFGALGALDFNPYPVLKECI